MAQLSICVACDLFPFGGGCSLGAIYDGLDTLLLSFCSGILSIIISKIKYYHNLYRVCGFRQGAYTKSGQ